MAWPCPGPETTGFGTQHCFGQAKGFSRCLHGLGCPWTDSQTRAWSSADHGSIHGPVHGQNHEKTLEKDEWEVEFFLTDPINDMNRFDISIRQVYKLMLSSDWLFFEALI